MKNTVYKFSVFSFILIIFSCNKAKKQVDTSNNKNIEQAFFDYNEIEYYHNNRNNKLFGVGDFYDEFQKNTKDSTEFNLLIGGTPKNLKDSSFVKNLKKAGFEKIYLPAEKQKQLKKIFVEKDRKPEDKVALKPMFNDILIFRNNGKITGFSKLSFEYLQSRVIGTDSNTDYFPTDAEHKEIENILYKQSLEN